MPIVVSCACGKQFRAPDSSAGRRGKCPGCGGPLQVPALPTPEADPFAALSATAPATPGRPAHAPTPRPAVAARAATGLPPVPTAASSARQGESRQATRRPAPAPIVDDVGNDPDDYGAYDLKPTPAGQAGGPLSWSRPGVPAAAADEVYEDDASDDSAYEEPSSAAPSSLTARALAYASPMGSSGGTGRRGLPHGLLYLVLAVALVPLAWSVLFSGSGDSVAKRIVQTVEHHPEIKARFEALEESTDASEKQLFDLFPDHKIEGALHSRDTKVHWLYAALSGGMFFVGTLVVLPKASARTKHLLMTGLFTGTIGILLLLGVQLAAEMTTGRIWTGRSIVVLIFYLIKFIGFSYHAAMDPDTNLFVSLFGFTFGVGMCEELCKALPLIFVFRAGQGMTWRDACRWGFISGVGFGVSEGITYSSDYYNGIDGGGMYLVRFVSCVSLHAVWTAAAGITLFRRQNLLHDAGHWLHFLLNLVVLLIVPMLLHGLYDTLLKKDHEAMALLVAVASVGWLAWNVEKMLRTERDDPRFAAAMA